MMDKSVRRLSSVALISLAMIAIMPVYAMGDDTANHVEALQQQIDALTQRLTKLESQQSQVGAILNLQSEIDALKSDNAQLHGQLDEETHDLAVAEKRQTDLYQDLDTRLRALAHPDATNTQTPNSSAVATEPTTSASADTSSTQEHAYQAALTQFKQGDYAGAIVSFQHFIKLFPNEALAASAQYWIGNAYFSTKDFKLAQLAQQKLITVYPKSPKVPDALLNLSSAQIELGDMTGAHKTLVKLVSKYPDTSAAAMAKKRLQLLQGN